MLEEISVSDIATNNLDTLKEIWVTKCHFSPEGVASCVEEFKGDLVKCGESIIATTWERLQYLGGDEKKNDDDDDDDAATKTPPPYRKPGITPWSATKNYYYDDDDDDDEEEDDDGDVYDDDKVDDYDDDDDDDAATKTPPPYRKPGITPWSATKNYYYDGQTHKKYVLHVSTYIVTLKISTSPTLHIEASPFC